ncbi:purple acid phosphatase family protein [Aspergillus homomorphus CBS 101889]|uniref:Purple acid phosphatase n=1 Tax=Aspergillus homomorphus (strain CBS 101889) TaxID=1450537 RepID=A0A395HK29_ASPHC|nr:acid phosphatase [Aspergillus homomorphus CBS 101889]RAL08271.1 acid phosphatase [Aspergillus homomorphus CBS 101889]
MKTAAASALLVALSATVAQARPVADERYPYTGPAVPVGDWVDSTVNGNGKGFPRLVEPPAVRPASANPRNNVNVISLSYIPKGMHIHYQTPFGLGETPSVMWGKNPHELNKVARGYTHTYDRTPSCSEIKIITQCSQYFHEVSLDNLEPGTTYYYQIPAANGTTKSDVLSFKTAREAGDKGSFSVAVLNDMGYTNAHGTHKQLIKAANEGTAFAWHGGDISYADDWYEGILPCESSWDVCYNGTSTKLPGKLPVPEEYKKPLPAGEVPNQGGPQGGDVSVIYESNWDLWQQWLTNVTVKIPYMVMPGNHEAACAEFDGPGNVLTAYLNDDVANGTAAAAKLNYYSCPPSQRNFTAYQHRFRMPGAETGGVGNFWYSFDYGLAHFVSIDGETDFANSPEWPFAEDIKGNETHPTAAETFITDSGPFGAVDGSYKNTKNYAQYKWLQQDLAKVDRSKTPWVFVMSHRPMYSSAYSSYEKHVRDAFEGLLLKYGVDAYLSGHIHWYERLYPLGANQTIDTASIINNNTYIANNGKSLTHIINGMAGNIESHSEFSKGQGLTNITAVLDTVHYGFSKLTVKSETEVKWQFIRGDDGSIGDEVTLLKPAAGFGRRVIVVAF